MSMPPYRTTQPFEMRYGLQNSNKKTADVGTQMYAKLSAVCARSINYRSLPLFSAQWTCCIWSELPSICVFLFRFECGAHRHIECIMRTSVNSRDHPVDQHMTIFADANGLRLMAKISAAGACRSWMRKLCNAEANHAFYTFRYVSKSQEIEETSNLQVTTVSLANLY